MKQTPHCPACAAPLPELEAQQIVTCDFCGTDVNAEYQPAPAPALRSPPLSDEREYDDADDPPEDWQAGPWVHALLTSDRDEALALAESGNGRLTGEDGIRRDGEHGAQSREHDEETSDRTEHGRPPGVGGNGNSMDAYLDAGRRAKVTGKWPASDRRMRSANVLTNGGKSHTISPR